MWYRWPIEIDDLLIFGMVMLYGYVSLLEGIQSV